MTDGRLFLGVTTLLCIAGLLIGWRFAHMTENSQAQSRVFGLPVQSGAPVAQMRRFGRLFMIFVPLFWLLTALLCFGILGPVQGIETIKFN